MTTLELFQRLGLALAIGLLIGLERGWQEREGKPGSRAAGIRTHALIGLLGGMWGLLAPLAGETVLGFAALGFAGAFTLFEWRETQGTGSFSATGLVAGLLAFALGAYAVLGDMFAAGSAAVATTVVLAERRALHSFLERLKWVELRAALLLLVMTVVLLPVLPDYAIDPWGALNPYQIWLMVILIAAMSYGGYLAVRLAGEREGLFYAGIAGGLVSSTTVTWTFARLAKQHPQAWAQFTGGITASWAVSLIRTAVLAFVVSPTLGEHLALPLAAASLPPCVAAAIFFRRAVPQGPGSALSLEDPFDIGAISRFAVLLVVVMLGAKWLSNSFGQGGLLTLAAVSGLADVDPVTLSMAKMAGHGVEFTYAAIVILTAVAANTLAKCALATAFGGARFAAPLIGVAILAAASAAAMFIPLE